MPTLCLANSSVDRSNPYAYQRILEESGLDRAFQSVRSWPGYARTDVLSLTTLARDLGVAAVLYKDESTRFGLGSFKALGGIWGVSSALGAHAARPATGALHVCCASDGNHGRAVAWAARTLGAGATVMVPDVCSPQRAAMIAMLGADVIRVRGSYEDALDESVRQSRRKGWILVSDTGFIGSDEIPIRILSAYQIIAKELENAGLSSASHLFVQAGTGGLAASLCAFFWERLGKFRPRLTVVESDVAACLLESCRERRRVRIEGPHNTVMAGLACGEPSTVAWDILASGADAFAAVGDREVTEVVQDLAAGVYGTRCAAGESGAAGLCALRLMASHPANRSELGISADSVLLTIGTDGPLSSFTDPGAALVIK